MDYISLPFGSCVVITAANTVLTAVSCVPECLSAVEVYHSDTLALVIFIECIVIDIQLIAGIDLIVRPALPVDIVDLFAAQLDVDTAEGINNIPEALFIILP